MITVLLMNLAGLASLTGWEKGRLPEETGAATSLGDYFAFLQFFAENGL